MFVGITWALEGADFCKEHKEEADSGKDPEAILRGYHKGHIIRLTSHMILFAPSEKVSADATALRNASLVFTAHPLSLRRLAVAPWDAAMFGSLVAMLAAISACAAQCGWAHRAILAMWVISAAWFLLAFFWPRRQALLLAIGAIAVFAASVYCSALSDGFSSDLRLPACLGMSYAVMLFAYMCIYIAFRNLSYKEMADATKKMVQAALALALRFWALLSDDAKLREDLTGSVASEGDAPDGEVPDEAVSDEEVPDEEEGAYAKKVKKWDHGDALHPAGLALDAASSTPDVKA